MSTRAGLSTGETKTDFKERLQREGRWKEAVKRRENLKKLGMSAANAWKTIAAEFPIEPSAETVPAKASAKAPTKGGAAPRRAGGLQKADFPGLATVNIRQDVYWVYNNIDVTDVTAKDAPSPGAWSMREWARHSGMQRNEFYRNFCAKLLPSKKEMEEEDRLSDDGRDVRNTIDQLLARLARRNAVLPSGAQRG